MMKIFRAISAGLTLALLLAGTGCSVETTNNANNAPVNANVATTTTTTPVPPTPSPMSAAQTNALPVTLPVLDAFFADKDFASELKAKLDLNDEQINKLRTLARQETAKLRETPADDYTGTTEAARRHANEQIAAVIGEDKAQQLAALISERWSGGREVGDNNAGNASSNAPNSHGANGANFSTMTVPTDTRIIVNIPAYRMDAFEDGKLVKSYKVAIGYPEFPLPTGLRKASTVIFNPTWTPPDEPWVESSNKVRAGERVEAGSNLNPLGPVKIPIGLPSLIHGGKAPTKLGSFGSHGCVGLTTPQIQAFAPLLAKMGGTEITPQQMAEYAKDKKETKDVKLNHPVPVELRYQTIVVEDGKLHIYRDIYDRGTNTEENLRAVLEANGVSFDDLSEQERAQVLAALAQMSRDASGNPTTGANANSASESEQSDTSNRNSNNKNASAKKVNRNANTANDNKIKLTRSVRGKKEIVIEIAALKGKGYPAPVDLDTGSGAKKQNAQKGAPPSSSARKRD
jgi:lipoprotein-anchoring transpeptidase ErfK/SrfK